MLPCEPTTHRHHNKAHTPDTFNIHILFHMHTHVHMQRLRLCCTTCMRTSSFLILRSGGSGSVLLDDTGSVLMTWDGNLGWG